MKRLFFLSGIGRSGTSALVDVLNAHPEILVGQERYFHVINRGELTLAHFERARFLDIQPGDTHVHGGLKLRGDDPGARHDAAHLVGEKFPGLYRHFDWVFDRFPEARHLYIFRNPLSVIESYEARKADPDDAWDMGWKEGLEVWNASLAAVAALPPDRLRHFVILRYETLFASETALQGLFAALGLPPAPGGRVPQSLREFARLNLKPVPRRDDLRAHVAENADWDSYRALCRLAEAPRPPASKDTRP